MFKSQHGFSLMESVIGLALVGGIGVGVMKIQDMSTKTKLKKSTDQIVIDTARIIQHSLNNRAVCSQSLITKKAGDTVDKIVNAQVNPNNYNIFIAVGGDIVRTGDLIPNDKTPEAIRIDNMKIIENGGSTLLEVEFNLDPRDTKKIGTERIKKQFLIQATKDGSGFITNCHSESENLIESSAIESCRAMGGEWDVPTKKCKFIHKLTDTTPTNCGPGATYKTEVGGDGKLKITCIPCTVVKRFTRWTCEKKTPEANWIKYCYFKSGCAEDPSIKYGLEFWDFGTHKKTGYATDVGDKDNCPKKFKKCDGE